MEIMRINRPIELTDQEFLQLQLVIEAKRNMLIKKQKKIQRISKENAFLEQVKDNYLKYNNYIIKQKEDQVKALDLLNNYIKDLTISGQLSKNNIKDAKHEQNKIKKELKTIQLGLDKLMNDINDISEITTTLNIKK
jgi:hypothetical protein